MSGYDQAAAHPDWLAAQQRAEQERWAAWDAAGRPVVPQPPIDHEEIARQAAIARSQQEIERRIAVAVKSLNVSGRHLLKTRSFLIASQRRTFRPNLEWWDDYAPAWPVGEQFWDLGEGRYRGGPTAVLSGVTQSGELRPMEDVVRDEEVVGSRYPGRRPRFAGLVRGLVEPMPRRVAWEQVASALETLASRASKAR